MGTTEAPTLEITVEHCPHFPQLKGLHEEPMKGLHEEAMKGPSPSPMPVSPNLSQLPPPTSSPSSPRIVQKSRNILTDLGIGLAFFGPTAGAYNASRLKGAADERSSPSRMLLQLSGQNQKTLESDWMTDNGDDVLNGTMSTIAKHRCQSAHNKTSVSARISETQKTLIRPQTAIVKFKTDHPTSAGTPAPGRAGARSHPGDRPRPATSSTATTKPYIRLKRCVDFEAEGVQVMTGYDIPMRPGAGSSPSGNTTEMLDINIVDVEKERARSEDQTDQTARLLEAHHHCTEVILKGSVSVAGLLLSEASSKPGRCSPLGLSDVTLASVKREERVRFTLASVKREERIPLHDGSPDTQLTRRRAQSARCARGSKDIHGPLRGLRHFEPGGAVHELDQGAVSTRQGGAVHGVGNLELIAVRKFATSNIPERNYKRDILQMNRREWKRRVGNHREKEDIMARILDLERQLGFK